MEIGPKVSWQSNKINIHHFFEFQDILILEYQWFKTKLWNALLFHNDVKKHSVQELPRIKNF